MATLQSLPLLRLLCSRARANSRTSALALVGVRPAPAAALGSGQIALTLPLPDRNQDCAGSARQRQEPSSPPDRAWEVAPARLVLPHAARAQPRVPERVETERLPRHCCRADAGEASSWQPPFAERWTTLRSHPATRRTTGSSGGAPQPRGAEARTAHAGLALGPFRAAWPTRLPPARPTPWRERRPRLRVPPTPTWRAWPRSTAASAQQQARLAPLGIGVPAVRAPQPPRPPLRCARMPRPMLFALASCCLRVRERPLAVATWSGRSLCSRPRFGGFIQRVSGSCGRGTEGGKWRPAACTMLLRPPRSAGAALLSFGNFPGHSATPPRSFSGRASRHPIRPCLPP